jgi:hypothetical protein
MTNDPCLGFLVYTPLSRPRNLKPPVQDSVFGDLLVAAGDREDLHPLFPAL